MLLQRMLDEVAVQGGSNKNGGFFAEIPTPKCDVALKIHKDGNYLGGDNSHMFGMFTPIPGEMIHQMDWNHQLDTFVCRNRYKPAFATMKHPWYYEVGYMFSHSM